VPHTLAFTFFPAWVSSLREDFGTFKSRLIALNVHDAVMRLVEGGCDLLIAYHHESQPLPLDTDRYQMVSLGQETLAPYCKPDPQGRPLFPLPGRPGQPLPYLGYAPGAYLGQVADLLVRQANPPVHLDRVYETDMAEGLKVMALEGHGVAFLPASAVRRELQEGRLVPAAAEASLGGLSMTLDIRAYRQRPGGRGGEPAKRSAQALWAFLAGEPPA
jgi:DNA-binding transcriptional LysR family regulator